MGSGRGSNVCCRGSIRAPSASAGSVGSRAAGANRFRRVRFSRPLCMCCAPAANGRLCPRVLAAPAPFITTSKSGGSKAFSCACGARGWPNTTNWKASLGNGKAWTGRKAKLLWRKRRWGTTRLIGGKKGTKRSLLVDGRGAPLSLIVAGANRHDVKLLAQTLDAIVIQRPKPTKKRPQNLCVDKGYRGKVADQQMRARGYIPHIPTPAETGGQLRNGQLVGRSMAKESVSMAGAVTRQSWEPGTGRWPWRARCARPPRWSRRAALRRARDVDQRHGVGRRLDAGDVQLVELLDVAEDVGKLGAEFFLSAGVKAMRARWATY
jgi:hypothetical protein